MLVARRRLDRGDDLARDAQLGEVAEARLAVGAVVADRLVEADQALLDQVLAVPAGEEVGGGLEPDEALVARTAGGRMRSDRPALRARSESHPQPEVESETVLEILGHEPVPFSRPEREAGLLSGALLPWRRLRIWTGSEPEVQPYVARTLTAVMESCQGRPGAQDLVQQRRGRRADVRASRSAAQRQRHQRVAGVGDAPTQPVPLGCRTRSPRRRRVVRLGVGRRRAPTTAAP